MQVAKDAPCAGKTIERLKLPEGARVISVMRNGRAEPVDPTTQIQPGDQVLAILEPGKEDELRRVLLRD